MEDLFKAEQEFYQEAKRHAAEMESGTQLDREIFQELVNEYGRLLRVLRRITKMSERETVVTDTGSRDLADKGYYDELTGIFNKQFVEEKLKLIIGTLVRFRSPLSLLLIEIDFFDEFKAAYGDTEGNECLRAIAETVDGSMLRASDFAARYDRGEFVVILPDTDESGARVIARKILDNVRALNVPHKKSEAASFVTISVGATTSDVDFKHSSMDYISRAREALELSKHDGRDTYTFLSFLESKQ